MPIYEYRCDSCGHELEKLQRMNDPRLVDSGKTPAGDSAAGKGAGTSGDQPAAKTESKKAEKPAAKSTGNKSDSSAA